jgi:hypothetical protein
MDIIAFGSEDHSESIYAKCEGERGILGAFAKLQMATILFVMSVLLSIRKEQLCT